MHKLELSSIAKEIAATKAALPRVFRTKEEIDRRIKGDFKNK
jgi:hypothetical protein